MAAFYLMSLTSKLSTLLTILYKITLSNRCTLMGYLYFLLILSSVIGIYNSVFLAFLCIFFMDCLANLTLLIGRCNAFETGFFVCGSFKGFFNVFVVFFVFMLVLGFKLMRVKGVFSEVRIKKGLLSKSMKIVSDEDDCNDCEFNSVKNASFENGTIRVNGVLCNSCGDQKIEGNDDVLSGNFWVFRDENDSEFEEICNEDEVFDVLSLRKMVKFERRKLNAAHIELDKERMAASSSVDEAMAMILRLQNEKSALQIKVNQLERGVEEKRLHDQEVIQSLQWIIMKHEFERGLLEDRLRLCREKLRHFIKGEEWDQFECACPTPSAIDSQFGVSLNEHDE